MRAIRSGAFKAPNSSLRWLRRHGNCRSLALARDSLGEWKIRLDPSDVRFVHESSLAELTFRFAFFDE